MTDPRDRLNGPDFAELPDAIALALRFAPQGLRLSAACAFALDARMGRIISQTKEPIAAQMRLAWWRDELHKPAGQRAHGDALLHDVARYWSGYEDHLVQVIDGWEYCLSPPPMSREVLGHYASGRAAIFGALTEMAGHARHSEAAAAQGFLWALADFVPHCSHDGERALALELAQNALAACTSLPRGLRHLAILGALAARSIKRGGTPFLSQRGDALTVMRIGILGR